MAISTGGRRVPGEVAKIHIYSVTITHDDVFESIDEIKFEVDLSRFQKMHQAVENFPFVNMLFHPCKAIDRDFQPPDLSNLSETQKGHRTSV